jgi:uncharacterized protein
VSPEEALRVGRAAERLKLFPLPDSVLFPGAVIPLHIFEPRYRELVRDCLAADGVMGLGGVLPGWEADYQGRPPLRPLCCVAQVVYSHPHDDGRYDIALQGLTRAKIEHEWPPDQRYREVRVTPVSDPPVEPEADHALRRAMMELASRLPDPYAQPMMTLLAGAQGGALADLVCSFAVTEPARRLRLFEELDPLRRMVQAQDAAMELLATSGGGGLKN